KARMNIKISPSCLCLYPNAANPVDFIKKKGGEETMIQSRRQKSLPGILVVFRIGKLEPMIAMPKGKPPNLAAIFPGLIPNSISRPAAQRNERTNPIIGIE